MSIFCINDFCHDQDYPCDVMESAEVARRVMVDEIYYRMTGGGIVFGGGEPLTNTRFIREVIQLLPDDFLIRVETSLNVPWTAVETLYEMVDEWIIDIKDMNPEIYSRYTGKDNTTVIDNCRRLSDRYRSKEIDPMKRLLFRVPLIPNYNTRDDVEKSVAALQELGRIERFKYTVKG